MNGMKGKLLKKLKTIQAIGTLKQGLVFQLIPAKETFPTKKCPQTTSNCGEEDFEKENLVDNIGLSKHFKDLNNEGLGPEFSPVHDKETLSPTMKFKDNNLSFFKETTMNQEIPNEINLSLLDFEEKCPPGGSEKVVLYTTSLRGIRKTYEDCNAIRFLLESFKVSFSERDVSLHQEFREELWKILGEKTIPPRLFIKGRYIGGADEVVGVLHEQGKLKKLLEGIPLAPSNSPCTGCANVRFSVCCNCNGSRKVDADGENDDQVCYIRCPECNENGLVKCVICC